MLEDHARLLAIFRRVLLLSAGVSASAEACGGDSDGAGRPDAGARDGETDVTVVDAGPARDARTDGARSDADAAIAPAFPTCKDASAGTPYFVDGSSCYYYIDFSCAPTAPVPNDCLIPASECLSLCSLDAAVFECRYDPGTCAHGTLVADAGEPVTVGCGICAQGRRPAGLAEERFIGSSPLGVYLARAAYLEAASVTAFRQLHAELRALGAPRHLVERARRAAADEARHARAIGQQARRFGGKPPTVHLKRAAPRGLAALARENAIEGCVRETFGALVASWQAERARDPELRRHMVRIAADETRHAALAWAVDRWAARKLGSRARSSVAAARRGAVEQLANDLRGDTPRELQIEAGLPTGHDARAWHRALSDELWGERLVATRSRAYLSGDALGSRRDRGA